MLYLLLVTYCTIFLAELLGDKTIYTVSSLTVKFHASSVFCGITIAFMFKVLAAVFIGQVITNLSSEFVAATSATTFFATALLIWFKREEEEKSVEKRHYSSRAMFVSFAAIFFSEWGDAGQLISALLVTRYQAPVVVWLGATLALTTKGILAIALGVKLRRRVPKHILRPVSVAICLIMGVVSAVNLWI